jgi:hypothetical protein
MTAPAPVTGSRTRATKIDSQVRSVCTVSDLVNRSERNGLRQAGSRNRCMTFSRKKPGALTQGTGQDVGGRRVLVMSKGVAATRCSWCALRDLVYRLPRRGRGAGLRAPPKKADRPEWARAAARHVPPPSATSPVLALKRRGQTHRERRSSLRRRPIPSPMRDVVAGANSSRSPVDLVACADIAFTLVTRLVFEMGLVDPRAIVSASLVQDDTPHDR